MMKLHGSRMQMQIQVQGRVQACTALNTPDRFVVLRRASPWFR